MRVFSHWLFFTLSGASRQLSRRASFLAVRQSWSPRLLRPAHRHPVPDKIDRTANGYFDKQNNAADRHALRERLNAQRTKDALTGTPERTGGVIDPVPADAPQFVKDYHDYYKTPRGYHARSLNSNKGFNVTAALPFLNMPILAYSGEIRSAVLMVHGEKAHSVYFSRDAFAKLTGTNKELLIVPGASHTDLYDDKAGKIPYEKIIEFFKQNLK